MGVGLVLQNPIIAVQADCDDEEKIPQKTALVRIAHSDASLSPKLMMMPEQVSFAQLGKWR